MPHSSSRYTATYVQVKEKTVRMMFKQVGYRCAILGMQVIVL